MRCAKWVLAVLGVAGLVATAWGREATWVKVEAPEFTLIGTLPAKAAVERAEAFSQFIAALGEFVPVDRRMLPRLTLVVFDRDKEFAPFRPLNTEGKPKDVAGFMAHWSSWAVAGLSAEDGAQAASTIFHEGVHWFLHGSDRSIPVWVDEGLAEVFSTFESDGKTLSWGKAIGHHVAMLRQMRPMPLEQLMVTGREGLFHGDGLETNVFYAQSWVFTHYLMFGKRDRTAPGIGLNEYAAALGTEPTIAAAFTRAFGASPKEFDQSLARYLRSGRYYVSKRPVAALAPLTAVPASAVEVSAALGRLALGGGHTVVGVRYGEAAVAADAGYVPGVELLGHALLASDEKERAVEQFERAATLGSLDFYTYLTLGGEAINGRSSDAFSEAEARTIANYFKRALNLRPLNNEAYAGLAMIVFAIEQPDASDLPFLERGCSLFPADARLTLGVAVVKRRTGDPAGARALLDAVLAKHETLPRLVLRTAESLDAAWVRQEIEAEVTGLRRQEAFAEAETLVDRALAKDPTGPLRTWLLGLKAEMHIEGIIKSLKAVALAGDSEGMVRHLAELEASAAPERLKSVLRKQVEEVIKRNTRAR